MVTTLVGMVRSHFGSTYYSNRPVFPTILLPFTFLFSTWSNQHKKKRKRVEFSLPVHRWNCLICIVKIPRPRAKQIVLYSPGWTSPPSRDTFRGSERSDNLLQGILTWGTLIILNPKSTPFPVPSLFRLDAVFPSPSALTYCSFLRFIKVAEKCHKRECFLNASSNFLKAFDFDKALSTCFCVKIVPFKNYAK